MLCGGAVRYLWILVYVMFVGSVLGAEYFVATDGDDQQSGAIERPFRTIQRAADIMEPGDICTVREGVYRETVRITRSGTAGRPIRFRAMPGELVVISGTDVLTGDWTRYRDHIYALPTDRSFEQVFCNGAMMVEARWPNAGFDEMLDSERWATTDIDSRYGKVVDEELADTGIDWTGALAVLNVAHQFFSWTREVESHSAGDAVFTYAKDLPGITHHADKTTPWEDDRYYLTGKLEALDMETEWYRDDRTGTFYLWPPDDEAPEAGAVEVKVREYGFLAEDVHHVEVSGFHLFAATFSFTNSSHCIIDGLHLRYPTYSRGIMEMEPGRPRSVVTLMSGTRNILRNSSLAFSSGQGFRVLGSHNLIENNLVHDFCWTGHLGYTGIYAGANGDDADGGTVIRRNTIYNSGNAGLQFNGMPNVICEYNHVFDGGKQCKDVSLIYTQCPQIAGSIIRYNWVHDCYAPHIALGIRGDDQTRSLTIHHNVVWNIGWEGIVCKGDNNRIHNNTCFGNASGNIGKRKIGDILLQRDPEPHKPWKQQWPLLKEQNRNTEVFNNAAPRIVSDRNKWTPPLGPMRNNMSLRPPMLADIAGYDFRPRPGSPLIDAGVVIPGYTDGYLGDAPDIGAYEHGDELWMPGYRNSIRAVAGAGGITVSLAMPPPAPIRVHVRPEPESLVISGDRTLRFMPENWWIPHIITVTDAGQPARVHIESPGMESVVVSF